MKIELQKTIENLMRSGSGDTSVVISELDTISANTKQSLESYHDFLSALKEGIDERLSRLEWEMEENDSKLEEEAEENENDE